MDLRKWGKNKWIKFEKMGHGKWDKMNELGKVG
jgi:hypothetical protein